MMLERESDGFGTNAKPNGTQLTPMLRRSAGLNIFPAPPPLRSACPASTPPPPASAGYSPAPTPSSASLDPASARRTLSASDSRCGHAQLPALFPHRLPLANLHFRFPKHQNHLLRLVLRSWHNHLRLTNIPLSSDFQSGTKFRGLDQIVLNCLRSRMAAQGTTPGDVLTTMTKLLLESLRLWNFH